jgi:uncharacterized protein with gpF-like domain
METAQIDQTAAHTETPEALLNSFLTQTVASSGDEVQAVQSENKKEGGEDNEGQKETKEEAVEVRERFENLTRAEKKALEKRQKFEADIKAFEEQKNNYISKSEIEKLAQENALELIKKFGGDPDQAIKRYLSNDGKDPTFQIEELKKELTTLRSQLEEKETKQVETRVKEAEKEQETKIKDFKTYVKDYTLKAGEKYEFLSEYPAFEEEVFKAWFEVANKTGTPPELDVILDKLNGAAEKHFEDQVKKSKALPKLFKKLGMVEEPQAKKAESFTLTNSIPQSAPTTNHDSDKKKIPSDKERTDAAVAAFQAALAKKA